MIIKTFTLLLSYIVGIFVIPFLCLLTPDKTQRGFNYLNNIFGNDHDGVPGDITFFPELMEKEQQEVPSRFLQWASALILWVGLLFIYQTYSPESDLLYVVHILEVLQVIGLYYIVYPFFPRYHWNAVRNPAHNLGIRFGANGKVQKVQRNKKNPHSRGHYRASVWIDDTEHKFYYGVMKYPFQDKLYFRYAFGPKIWNNDRKGTVKKISAYALSVLPFMKKNDVIIGAQ